MTLPTDVARCPGSQPDPGDFREGCADCLRRTSPPQASQPASQPLTQPEKQRLWNDAMYENRSSTTDAAMEYGSAIEQAHGIGAQKGKP